MERSVFLFHMCITAVAATAISFGIIIFILPLVKSLRQYTISAPRMARGKISPRYFTNFGISLLLPNTAKGKSLVAKVAAAATKL